MKRCRKRRANKYEETYHSRLGFSAKEEFEVRVSDKEEIYKSSIPEEIVKELSLMKAENVASDLLENIADGSIKDTVVIGADTIVVLDDEILGKPSGNTGCIPAWLFLISGRTARKL